MRTLLAILSFILVASVSAQSKVVVIPLGGDEFKPLQNIITVGLKNADFINPNDALRSIPLTGPIAPSQDNPYLIVVGPGIYEMSTPMPIPSHVSVTGSGRSTTILRFDLLEIDMASGVAVYLGENVNVSDLSIENIVDRGSGGGYGVALATESDGVVLERLIILSSGNQTNTGIEVLGGSMQINDVSVLARGGFEATGIVLFNDQHSRLNNVSVQVEGALDYSAGILFRGTSPKITNTNVEAVSPVGDSVAIRSVNSSPQIVNSEVVSRPGGETSQGLELVGESSAPNVFHSIIRGATAAINFSNQASKATVVGSKILGGVINDLSGTQCRDNYDAKLVTVDC